MLHFHPERLVVISLRGEKPQELVHFYRHVVGLSMLPHHDRPAFDLGNGCHLVIIKGQPPPPGPEGLRFPAIAFAVADLAKAIQHLQGHGVELPWGLEASEHDRWAMFYDPAGNLIEFAQFSRPAQFKESP